MNWNIPAVELDCDDFFFNDDHIYENELIDSYTNYFGEESFEKERFSEYDRSWKEIPNMDVRFPWTSCKEVVLEAFNPPCISDNVLGYYIPYHFVMVSYKNKYGVPRNHEEVLKYNDNLPRHSRFGIHLCEKTIINYIEQRSNSGNYFEVSLALLVQNIIGHEWGHYRAELNAIQQMIHLQRVSSNQSLSYVNYILRANKTHNNFEEVFADYCGLKLGIFNVKFKNPNPRITRAEQFQMTKLQLSLGLFNNNKSPYGDLKYWMKNSREMNDAIESLVWKPNYANKRVKLSLNLNSADSPIKSDLIDVLTNNQAQFIKNRQTRNFIVSSRGPYVDCNKLDSHWQYTSKDEFMKIPPASNKTSLTIEISGSRLDDVLEKILNPVSAKGKRVFKLPLDTFPELLRIGPVLVH